MRPAPDESLDWESTENLYIEGDNLEVLKLLQKSYFNQIKMIYIDPPYNTGKDFVYKDNFRDNLANYQRLTGQRDGEGSPLTTNSESDGRYHSNWLNMMYPRLKLARNLLTDDGVIFISIDDNEQANLKKICDELYGEENFVFELIRKTKSTTNDAKTGVNIQHEGCLVYAKDSKYLNLLGGEKDLSGYSNPDNDPNGDWISGDPSAKSGNMETGYFPVVNPYTGKKDYPPKGMFWRFSKNTIQKHIDYGTITFKRAHKDNERGFIYKRYKKDLKTTKKTMDSLVFVDNNFLNQKATKELLDLQLVEFFTYPKGVDFIKNLLVHATDQHSIILDFFSGSATTAHAVMQLNAEDKGNRKFICIQLPEPTDEKSEAFKAGYQTICDIGKERIRRAATKIRNEHPETDIDLGFKVFKLDTSNLKKWQPESGNLEKDLLDAIDNILPDRNNQDLLYEVLIKYGLPLTYPVEEIKIADHTIFNVANGSLIACFDEGIDLETVQAIAVLSTAEQPILRVVFRDTSFVDDIVKTNAIQRLLQAGIEDVLSI
ncbi:site-specific DNA-methyltransferase [Oligella urethralis]|uniref:site-specific DNA-methyltransferase n=1 Tax=Oligella urethralis TaxID=90245 RepID=UPI001CA58C22|nr:site-specific DNA-methyltransferase [Oligella urethralis]